MIKNIPAFVPQSFCLECKGCCRFEDSRSYWRPRLGVEEIPTFMKEHEQAQGLGKSSDIFDMHQYVTTKSSLTGCTSCRFLNEEDNQCKVYGYRPFECQLYPFLLSKQGYDVYVSVHLNCPYVAENGKDSQVFQNTLAELKSYFSRRDVKDFILRNISIVGDYSLFKEELDNLFIVNIKE